MSEQFKIERREYWKHRLAESRAQLAEKIVLVNHPELDSELPQVDHVELDNQLPRADRAELDNELENLAVQTIHESPEVIDEAGRISR